MAYKKEIVNGLKWLFKGSKCVTIMQAPKAFSDCWRLESVTLPKGVRMKSDSFPEDIEIKRIK